MWKYVFMIKNLFYKCAKNIFFFFMRPIFNKMATLFKISVLLFLFVYIFMYISEKNSKLTIHYFSKQIYGQ